MDLAVISQSVGRRSLLELHCKTVSEFIPDASHYIYFPYGKSKVFDLLQDYNVKGFEQADVKWTRNERVPDSGYGLMLNEVSESKFLFLHDDVYLTELFDNRKLISALENFDFYGLLDSVSVSIESVYSKIRYDGKRLADLRLGTFFLAGDKNLFLTEGFSTGNVERLIPIYSQLKYGLLKLRFNGMPKIDGGFDFNFRILKGKHSVQRDSELPGVIHLERFTNFFQSRGLDASSVDENSWLNNDYSYSDNKRMNDYPTLLKYSNILESHGIFDEFLNVETIKRIFKNA